MEIDQDELYINCTILPDHYPLVYWSYQGKEGTLSISEARAKARAILSAAAIAESEAAIIDGMRSVGSKPKGFGARQKREDEAMLANLLLLVRNFRPPLPDGLEVIYGRNTKQPLLVLSESWYGTKIQFPPDLAVGHAMQLLGAAEAGQSDAFLYHFMGDQIGIETHEVQPMIREFSLFRQRNQLEDLFRGDRP